MVGMGSFHTKLCDLQIISAYKNSLAKRIQVTKWETMWTGSGMIRAVFGEAIHPSG